MSFLGKTRVDFQPNLSLKSKFRESRYDCRASDLLRAESSTRSSPVRVRPYSRSRSLTQKIQRLDFEK